MDESGSTDEDAPMVSGGILGSDGDDAAAPAPVVDDQSASHVHPAFNMEAWLCTDPSISSEWYPPIEDYDPHLINKDLVTGLIALRSGVLRDEDIVPLTAQIMAGETIAAKKQEAVLDGCPILWIPTSPWVPMLMDASRRGSTAFVDSASGLMHLYTIEHVLRENVLHGPGHGEAARTAIIQRLDHLDHIGSRHMAWFDSMLSAALDGVPAHRDFLMRWGARGDWPRDDPVVSGTAQNVAMTFLQIVWEYTMRKIHLLEMRCCVLRSVPPAEWVTLMTPVYGLNAMQFAIDSVLEAVVAGEKAALRWPAERPRPAEHAQYKLLSDEDRRALMLAGRPWGMLRRCYNIAIHTKDDNTKLAAYAVASRTIRDNGTARKYGHLLLAPLPQREVIELPPCSDYDQVRAPNMLHRLNAVIVVQMAFAMWSTPSDATYDASGIFDILNRIEDEADHQADTMTRQ